MIEREEEPEAADNFFEVWPENAETVNVFRALETQWYVVPIGKRLLHLGLRYGVLDEVWKRLGVAHKDRNEVFRGLQEMERAALPVLNERAAE